MIIIKEPHNHKEASRNITIKEEVSQSEVNAQELFSHPDFSDSDVLDQDVSPPDCLDGTFRP